MYCHLRSKKGEVLSVSNWKLEVFGSDMYNVIYYHDGYINDKNLDSIYIEPGKIIKEPKVTSVVINHNKVVWRGLMVFKET